MTSFLQFPKNFIWGAATSAFQIEGAVNSDCRGASIWDTFCSRPGNIFQNQNASVACNHYHLWKQDVALMRQMGLKAYRFSIAWPRIFPSGKGEINTQGLDFYKRLIDELLQNNIQPFVTLYHWDLPQSLEDRAGWRNRDTAHYFADYAAQVHRALHSQVKHWITINEMPCIAVEGHIRQNHAPGRKDDARTVNQIIHHLLLAHGLSVQALRQNYAQSKIGIVHNPAIFAPLSDNASDWQAAKCAWSQEFTDWCLHNDWWLDPIFKASYPQDLLAKKTLAAQAPLIQQNDLNIISTPIDFLGLNIYSGLLVRAANNENGYEVVHYPKNYPHTTMPWAITPQVTYAALKILAEKYPIKEFFITENGATFDDVLENGAVHDSARVDFLKNYLASAQRAIAQGLPLSGYFAWSLMDNFEWALGYSKRFGLLYTDYSSQKRIFKDSGIWYQNTIAQNGFSL